MSEQTLERPALAGPRSSVERCAAWAGRACRVLILRAHALAERLDLAPPEFGRGRSLRMTDAEQVVGEWLRQLRRWAAFYPEEAFAWKIGAAVLALALTGLVLAVGGMA